MFLNLLSGHTTPDRGISYLGLELSIRNILNGPKEPLCLQLCYAGSETSNLLSAGWSGLVWGKKSILWWVCWLVGWFDLVLETESWYIAHAGLQLGILLS